MVLLEGKGLYIVNEMQTLSPLAFTPLKNIKKGKPSSTTSSLSENGEELMSDGRYCQADKANIRIE